MTKSEARVSAPCQGAGLRRQYGKTFTTGADAQQRWLNAELAALSNGIASADPSITLKRWLESWLAHTNNRPTCALAYGDSILVGHIELSGARPKDRCATIGIALGREHIGRGYGTDAMRVIVDYAFREMGLHRIQLTVAPFNPAGIRAYGKAGFVEEGRHREAVWHDGRWYDEVMMSVLDHEWAARIKAESEGDLTIDGPTIAAHAFRAGLVDVVDVVVVPVMIGGGTSIWPDGVRLELRLLEERRFSGGMVALRYAAMPASGSSSP